MNAVLLEAKAGDVRIPRRAMFLREPSDEARLELGKGEDPKLFSMVALTGKPLAHWWFGTLAIELSGIRMKQNLPVLKDHDTDQRVGFTTSLRHEPGRGIVAEGRLMDSSDAAKSILADAAQGFPWQASTYLQASKILRVPQGQEAKCNGKVVQGPATIFLESTLREVTFTALGVDDDTSATPLSSNNAGEEVAVLLTLPTQGETTMTEKQAADTATEGGKAVSIPTTDKATLAAETKAERDRVTAILANSADVQGELRSKLIADGVPVEAALAALNKDFRERLAASSNLSINANVSLANGNTANVADTSSEDSRLKAMPEGPEKCKAEFAADAKLRAEFGDDVTLYIGWKTNELRRVAALRAE